MSQFRHIAISCPALILIVPATRLHSAGARLARTERRVCSPEAKRIKMELVSFTIPLIVSRTRRLSLLGVLAALLAAPASTAVGRQSRGPATDLGLKGPRVLIRIASSKWRVPIAPAYVNGRGPYWFMIDTGLTAATVEVSHKLAAMLRLSVGPFTLGPSLFGSRVEFAPTHLSAFQLGSKHDLPRSVGVNSQIDDDVRRQGVDVSGLIGLDYFAKHTVKFDLDHAALTISRGGAIGIGNQFRVEPSLGLLLDTKVNGIPFRFLFDTGSTGTYISPRVAKRLGLELKHFTRKRLDGGQAYAQLASVWFGGTVTRKVVAIVAESVGKLATSDGVTVDGIIGYDIWSRYIIAFDFLTNKFTVKPRATK